MNKVILVIEDQEDNRRIVRDLLTSVDFRIIEAVTGEDGVRSAELHRPDLILMDIQLPDFDGYEATRRIRANPELKSIPIIAVTAFAMKGDEERIRQGGCEAYLSKPISITKFIETVKAYLGDS